MAFVRIVMQFLKELGVGLVILGGLAGVNLLIYLFPVAALSIVLLFVAWGVGVYALTK
jgi:hypothetical protein